MTRRKKWGKGCSTGKRGYRDNVTAMMVLARADNSRHTGKIPVRTYRCPECGRWHLTSRP